MLASYLAALLGVILTATGQVLMKVGADRTAHRHYVMAYLNPFCLAAYALLIVVTLLNLYAFKRLPLKMAVVIVPFTYIFVGLYSYLLLKERLARHQLWGALIILVGIVVFNLSAKDLSAIVEWIVRMVA